MDGIKRMLNTGRFLILILSVAVTAESIGRGNRHTEEKKMVVTTGETAVEIGMKMKIKTRNIEVETEEEYTEGSKEPEKQWIPQAGDCLLSEEEKGQLQDMVLTAAESVSEIYRNIMRADAPAYSSGIAGTGQLTAQQRKVIVEELGNIGLVSVEEETNMQNGALIETFYAEYLHGRDAMVTVFEIRRDGMIGAITFLYRNSKLQTYYIGIGWNEGGIPEIQETEISDVAGIKLTEKGYFIYAYETVIAHASLRQYWRIKPLPEDCRELTQKYIAGLSYVNYNVLAVNWDSSNVEDILMPCMYEDIYRIATGENLKTENRKIPAEQYERIMTTYFPVSVRQVREHCGYDENSDSYPYEMIYATPHPPFGEVVDYTKHGDGTITLIVDGVWPDYNSDLAFQNTIVVRPLEDGTFRYLSNTIVRMELELPSVAGAEQLCR